MKNSPLIRLPLTVKSVLSVDITKSVIIPSNQCHLWATSSPSSFSSSP